MVNKIYGIPKILTAGLFIILVSVGCSRPSSTYKGLGGDIVRAKSDTVLADSIIYHKVRVDNNGNILPWYSADPGRSYDYVLDRVWDFWKNMAPDSNGGKYYMNHQVWRPTHDRRGLGGDQVMMALSSWDLYYDYTGDASLIDNMKYMADYYLAHSLTPPDSKWPDLPYPYNNAVESGIYDGDMILGKDYLQPDKAGSFGFELVHLYKKTGETRYLDAAVKIANTLAAKAEPGDKDHSPWPFKVNAVTGEPGLIVEKAVWYEGMSKDIRAKNPLNKQSVYTTNWTGALGLFTELISLHKGDTGAYKKTFDLTLNWLRNYPAKTNKWGPFFEDVPRWSDTQINGITYAMYIMEHPDLDPDWKTTVNNIFHWVHKELDDKEFQKYGVIVTDEQTAYRVPGNSHSSRQASVELLYWEKTGDTAYARNDVRELNWATYMVDSTGKNFYPRNDIWMTDGYGDYVRHYLRAMAAAPQLAPAGADHLLRSSSIVKKISYGPKVISYTVFDSAAEEKLRLRARPQGIRVNGAELKETTPPLASAEGPISEGWTWQSLDEEGKDGGILTIRHAKGNDIEISE